MGKITRTIVLLIVMLTILTMSSVLSNAYEAFDILNYDMHITLHENNVIDVVETINVEFAYERHGIYRDIVKKGYLYRQVDGKYYESPYKYKISKIDVEDHKFDATNEGWYHRIKIGDANKYVDGRQEYKISYRMNIGDDGIEAFDDFYYNVIGADWDTTIHNASIRIDMPKKFDIDNIGVSKGYNGSGSNKGVELTTSGNSILITTTEEIKPYEGITIRVQMDEGYFTGEKMPFNWEMFAYIFSVILLFGSFALFLLFGRDEKIVPVVEFITTIHLSPAEVGYVVDGYVDNKDVISLILHWAGKGYLKIVETKKGEFIFIKLKGIPNNDESYERYMFNKLFKTKSEATIKVKNKDEVKEREIEALIEELNDDEDAMYVHSSDLNNVFYITINSVKSKIKRKYIKSKTKKLYTVKSKGYQSLVYFLFTIPLILGMITTQISGVFNGEDATFLAIFLAAMLMVFFIAFSTFTKRWHSRSRRKRNILLLIMISILVILFLVCMDAVLSSREDLIFGLATVGSTFIMGLIAVFMHKRSEFANKLVGRIVGLRQFIETADKDRLEMMVSSNPDYFYDVLPYAYVLGVTNKWAKQFESIGVEPPSWFVGYDNRPFTTMYFVSSMNNNMGNIRSSMVSKPSSSGSSSGGYSSSSGGGFSGGGGGGGGGGSW